MRRERVRGMKKERDERNNGDLGTSEARVEWIRKGGGEGIREGFVKGEKRKEL